MSSKAEKERQKQIQDKCQTLLTQMLRDEDNKYCVDCDAKGPRWASWNLGIFLCIRCAGIHRNLGVHISKVKSVNLDSWTPEQVVSLQQMGNSRARAVYEANLPDNFRRPQTDLALESFVRSKYEAKKYIAREWVPPPIPKVNWDKELEEEAEKGRKKKKPSQEGQSQPLVRKLDNIIPQPLPKPTTSPKTQRSSASSNVASQQSKKASTDLLGLDTPCGDAANNTSSSDEMFTNFLSAPPPAVDSCTGASNVPKRTPEEDSFFNQPSSGSTEKKQMTTDSILALYSQSQPTQPINNAFSSIQGTGNFIGAGFQTPPTYQLPNGMNPMSRAGVPTQAVGATFQTAVNFGQPQQVPPAVAASNPFYNMGAAVQQPMNMPAAASSNVPQSAMRLPQQMSSLSLGGVQQPPPSSNMAFPPGQTLASNLWQ